MNKKSVTKSATIEILNKIQCDKAILAALRHSNSILSKQATKVWPLIFAKISNLQKGNSEENQFLNSEKPTYQEKAIFTALRCYAIFKQGNDNARSDNSDLKFTRPLFRILSQLRKDENIKEGLDRRVRIALSSSDFPSVVNALVHLIQILKANNPTAKINYVDLAVDLEKFQFSFEQARQVAIKWGRNYFWLDEKIIEELSKEK